MWQQLLRTVASDWSLFDYFVNVRCKYGSLYSPEDVYFANYSAALSLLANGVTCVLDHCHIMNSPAHSDAAVKGLKDAGIRGTFCYGFYENPAGVDGGFVEEGWDQKARENDARRVLKTHFATNDPRDELLTFGIAPNEAQGVTVQQVIDELVLCRDIGARLITNHIAMGNGDITRTPVVQALANANLLGPDLLFSHAGGLTDEELASLARSGGAVCATPGTEMQMGMGWPVAFRAQDAGCKACLGLDITSQEGSDFMVQMRLMLQLQRAREHNAVTRLAVGRRIVEVLKIGTIGGAAAMGLDHLTGSIEAGKKADIVLFRCDDINTVPYFDPVGEIVLHTSPANIDTVLVGGNVVKRNGKLVGVDWPALRDQLRNRSKRIVEQGTKIDTTAVAEAWKPLFVDQQKY